jgi:hypothetical protein
MNFTKNFLVFACGLGLLVPQALDASAKLAAKPKTASWSKKKIAAAVALGSVTLTAAFGIAAYCKHRHVLNQIRTLEYFDVRFEESIRLLPANGIFSNWSNSIEQMLPNRNNNTVQILMNGKVMSGGRYVRIAAIRHAEDNILLSLPKFMATVVSPGTY